MASDYGLNFGFRRSDESMATREGRFKTPAAGSALRLGSAIQLDAAVPGYYKQCAADAQPLSGVHGLLVQEESHVTSLFDAVGHDSYDLGLAKLDTLSVMWAGVGTKVWFRNTPAYSRGGRSKAAVQVLGTGLAVGDGLAWDGSKWIKADVDSPAWMRVTAVSGSTATDAYAEAVVGF